MQFRRHDEKDGPSILQTIAGRRLVRQIAIVVGAFIVGYLLTVVWLFPAPLFSSDHAVPRLLDVGVTEAKTRLEKQGFRVKYDAELPHPKAPKGTVVWQDPPPGTALPRNAQVTLSLSSGPAQVAVPDVVGFETPLGIKVLQSAGLQIGQTDSLPSAADPGIIVATRPGGGVGRDPGTTVDIVVSRGPAEISVPGVVGMTTQQARERLEVAGLALGITSSRVTLGKPDGIVVEQRPSPGTLSPRGGRVDLILSRKAAP
jgi:serine/threonine-protein kinase